MEELPLINTSGPMLVILLIVAALYFLGTSIYSIYIYRKSASTREQRDYVGILTNIAIIIVPTVFIVAVGFFVKDTYLFERLDAEGYIKSIDETYGIEVDKYDLDKLGFSNFGTGTKAGVQKIFNTITVSDPVDEYRTLMITLVWTGERFALYGTDGQELDRISH